VTGEEIAAIARGLFASFPMKKKIRLIGVSAGDLHGYEGDPQQLQLFEPSSNKEKLSKTVDELKEKFGSDAVRRGSQLL
jgi:DNA polymerase-4